MILAFVMHAQHNVRYLDLSVFWTGDDDGARFAIEGLRCIEGSLPRV